jgi:hypothetical protein
MIQLMAEELEPSELLPVGTVLHRRYVVEGVLGRGTYGITYFGHDDKTGTRIAIKEYFPYSLAHRIEQSLTLTPKIRRAARCSSWAVRCFIVSIWRLRTRKAAKTL